MGPKEEWAPRRNGRPLPPKQRETGRGCLRPQKKKIGDALGAASAPGLGLSPRPWPQPIRPRPQPIRPRPWSQPLALALASAHDLGLGHGPGGGTLDTLAVCDGGLRARRARGEGEG
eukprot:5675998-Prymnesium_polylepis.1